MIRFYILAIFILLSITTIGKTKFVDGYIITLEQDTVYGLIKIKVDKKDKLMPSKIQEKIIFLSKGGRRAAYKAGSIRSFYFYYDFETLTFASVPYFKDGKRFMKVFDESGYLKLYQFFPDDEKGLSSAYELAEFVYSSSGFAEKSFFYIIKPDGTTLLIGRHTPKNKIFSFFADYKGLADKIDSREYKYTDVFRIVREYNEWKQTVINAVGSSETDQSVPENMD